MSFEEVTGRYDGPELEQEILDLWREHDVFNRSIAEGEGKPLYIWNEGPPTANGKPGIHHVLARTFKDLFPRFKTMQGYHCPRKAGWDTHGLPVEHEVEKELGIFDKAEIERQIGVAEFTRRCRESVMRYIGDWEKMTERMGFWVNMDEAYYTLNNEFIESVWWLLKTMWDKGLIYQGHKVVPYDPRIGATLSSHEVALGYKEVEDPSVTIRFRLADQVDTSFLVWTTTPWTLPSNLALAVHPEVDYVYVKTADETLIVAEALRESVLRDQPHEVVKTVKGTELVGIKYERLFDYLPATGPICQVWPADFVTIEDGTGIVHCAPGYGEDDARLCQANGIPVVHGVGLDGCFLDIVEPVAGKFFKDADPIIIDLLTQRGLMFRSEKYLHNYPHGWRTGDPLIYYAKNAWYIRTSEYRERMVALNQTINWVPSTIRDGRFGNWLANNIDWALSRERFWGTPLPVWTDGDGDFMCIGSVAELETLCGRSLKEVDLHRPAVDEITFTHPDNGREYRRVPDVITVALDETPFWEALDQVLDQAEMTTYNYAGEAGAVAVIARQTELVPRLKRAAYSGVFRFEAVQLEAIRDLRNPQTKGLKLYLEIAWEPRTAPIAVTQPLALLTLADENEGEIAVDGQGGTVSADVSPESFAAEVEVPLELPPRGVQRIASLKGELAVLVPGREESFEFGGLLDARNVEQQRAGATVVLERMQKNGDVHEVRMVLRFEKAANALESHRGWVFHNDAYLLDANGERVDHAGYETTRQTVNEVGLAYKFVVEDGLKGHRFVYRSPAAILPKSIAYELKDLPLP